MLKTLKGFSMKLKFLETLIILTSLRYLNISKTNILRPAKCEDDGFVDVIDREENDEAYDSSIDEFTLDEDDF